MNFLKSLNCGRLIAILRGVKPEEVLEIASILVEGGIKMIEVPLNSVEAFKSIEKLTSFYGSYEDVFIGAGTVCTQDDAIRLKQINASLVISPNTDIEIVKKTKELGLISIPGFITPSEAYSALNAGADCLKLFPFARFGVSYYSDIKVILPAKIPIIVVGGVDETNIDQYLKNGVKYFGIGSSLYKPSMSLELLKKKVDYFVGAVGNYV